jgi:predicted nuclease with TOPRIM domain
MNVHAQTPPQASMVEVPTVAKRLDELRSDWTAGQRRLESLDDERQRLRETLLRIAGAIQVLEELSGEVSSGATAAAT